MKTKNYQIVIQKNIDQPVPVPPARTILYLTGSLLVSWVDKYVSFFVAIISENIKMNCSSSSVKVQQFSEYFN